MESKAPESKKSPSPASKARLSVVETVYHQVLGEQPTHISSRYCHNLSTNEQPYIRRVTVGSSWEKLDTGWLKDRVSWIHIQNEEGRNPTVNPTEEQRKELESLSILISLEYVSFARISPRESLRFQPSSPSELFIRCESSSARCTITAYPE